MIKTKSTQCLIMFVLLLLSSLNSHAQTPTSRVTEIQKALLEAKLDGWLFYDFRGSDPLAYRILKLGPTGITTRRWFYFIPAKGEPVKIVHTIEREKLDKLPGTRLIYREWKELHDFLRDTVGTFRRGKDIDVDTGPGRPALKGFSIAMQYSRNNDIPYVSRVDGGTIELIRTLGTTLVSSADLVQRFEAVWTDRQKHEHDLAANKIHQIIVESFAEIARRIRGNVPTTEYDIQQFMQHRFAEEYLTNENDPPIVAVNANAANPHYQPTREINSPIKRGDFVLFDVWGKMQSAESVYADESWTGYVDETVPAEYTRIFNIVREARDAAIAFIQTSLKSGKSITGASVDDVSRAVITRAGYGPQFLHRTGHSIGEEVHGNGANIDNLETKDSRRIIPRTCFSIEPGIYLEGKFGVRSEINVYIVNDREAVVTGQPIQTEVIAILK